MAKSDAAVSPAPRPSISVVNFTGAVAMMIFLPPFTYYVWNCVVEHGGALVAPVDLLSKIPAPTPIALALAASWFLLQAALQIAAPGKTVPGTPLADGQRLAYKMNGWFAFWFSMAAAGLAALSGLVAPSVLYDQFGPLLTIANLFTFAHSFYIYWLGKASPKTERITGNKVYDFFMGTALNPRVGSFDWKLFCELRPGLIGWVLIDLSMAAKQYQLHHTVTA